MLGLCGCASFSLVVARRGYSLVMARGLLPAAVSLVVEHRLPGAWASVAGACGLIVTAPGLEHRLSSWGTLA